MFATMVLLYISFNQMDRKYYKKGGANFENRRERENKKKGGGESLERIILMKE